MGRSLRSGAYFAVTFHGVFGWWGVLLAPLAVGAVGVAVELTLIRRLYGKEPLMVIVLTFALALLIEAVIRVVWGAGARVPEAAGGLDALYGVKADSACVIGAM